MKSSAMNSSASNNLQVQSGSSGSVTTNNTTRSTLPGYQRRYPTPFLCTSILGYHLTGIVDTGSSESILGKTGIEIVRKHNLPTKRSKILLSFAGGSDACVQEEVQLDVFWHGGRNKSRLNFLLLPGFPHAVILGRDFICEVDLVINLRLGLWSLGSDPFRYFRFDEVCRHRVPQYPRSLFPSIEILPNGWVQLSSPNTTCRGAVVKVKTENNEEKPKTK